MRLESRRRIVQLLATGKVGGAQGSVTDLMLRQDRSRFAVEAISLTDGPAVDRMRRLNLPVTVLDEPDDRLAVRRLAAHLLERKVDLLHAHMFRAETVATRGFDAESLQYVDMLQAGIIDPTKVERVALQNAASIASLLLTTEALITDIPEEKPAAAPAMPHGDMY